MSEVFPIWMPFVVHMGKQAGVSYPNSKNISVMRLATAGFGWASHADGAAGDAGATVRLCMEDNAAADDAVITIEVENIVTLVNSSLACVVSIRRS